MLRYGTLPCARTFELVSPAGRLMCQAECHAALIDDHTRTGIHILGRFADPFDGVMTPSGSTGNLEG